MKWTFLKQVQARRTSANAKFSLNKRPRLRYRQGRLLDLFCTMKRRSDSAIGDLSSGCDESTDVIDSYDTLNSFPVDAPSTPSEEPTPCSTLVDLLKTHSNALRRPIPFTGVSPPGVSGLGQPAFCPACQHVVILLPKKRQNNRLEESNCYQQTVSNGYYAKRKRVEAFEETSAERRTYKKSRDATRGHFNPSYTPYHRWTEELDTPIYAEVFNETDGDNEGLLGCSSQPSHMKVRQKRKAVRRLTQPLPRNDSFETDHQSVMDMSFFGGFTADLPDQPWMTSTLRLGAGNRFVTIPYDVETVYDTVASDSDSEPDYVSVASSDAEFELIHPDRLWSGGAKSISDVKRVRREYFLCEE